MGGQNVKNNCFDYHFSRNNCILRLFFHGLCFFTQLKTNQGELDSLKSTVTELNDYNLSLQNDVDNLNINISNLKLQIASLEENISGLESKSNSIDTEVSNIKQNVSAIEPEITSLNDDITELVNNTSSLKDNITSLQDSDVAPVKIAARLEPSIVKIETEGNKGSGIIFSNDGYVITNEHVIKTSSSIKVVLMEKDTYSATIVASDADRDLAILKIQSEKSDFPAVEFGSSKDIIIGQMVLAIGYPQSYELIGPATFTMGIVSAFQTLEGDSRAWIQTDAAINLGNSGGALVDMQGMLIGINTEALFDDYTGEGVTCLGFAIPIDEVKTFIHDNSIDLTQ